MLLFFQIAHNAPLYAIGIEFASAWSLRMAVRTWEEAFRTMASHDHDIVLSCHPLQGRRHHMSPMTLQKSRQPSHYSVRGVGHRLRLSFNNHQIGLF
jgi:hypothetical protein